MNIKYITMTLNSSVDDTQYCLHYEFKVRFICNFLSKKIRKIKFQTNGSFDTISIDVGGSNSPEYLFNKILQVSVPFNKARYEVDDDMIRCDYFIDLFQQAFILANEITEIPIDYLNECLCALREAGFKNVWIEKRKYLKEIGAKVEIKCILNSTSFSAYMILKDAKSKQAICTGRIVRTKPDEVYFSGLFKDIIVKDDFIYIENCSNIYIIKIDLNKALKGVFHFDFMDCPFDDADSIKDYKYFIQELSYEDGN